MRYDVKWLVVVYMCSVSYLKRIYFVVMKDTPLEYCAPPCLLSEVSTQRADVREANILPQNRSTLGSRYNMIYNEVNVKYM